MKGTSDRTVSTASVGTSARLPTATVTLTLSLAAPDLANGRDVPHTLG